MRKLASFRIVVLAAAVACGDSVGLSDFLPEPGSPPPVATDAAVYTLLPTPAGHRAAAVATYTNTTGRTVYFRRCMPEDTNPMFRFRRTGADSTAPWSIGVVWACVGGVSTGRVLPGASLTLTVGLGSPGLPFHQPPADPQEGVGHFRLELDLCAEAADDPEDCIELPQPAKESNAFEVRYPSP